jgi:hypothetical protein
VSAGGTDAVRQIVAGGDMFISGTLRSADLGGARQGLTLSAPMGTIYISGTVDTSGAQGSGQAGGPLKLSAQQVVVTGNLLTAGGKGTTGGAAGPVAVTTAGGIFLSGSVDGMGGQGAAAGGAGANLALQAAGDLVFGGVTQLAGGSATQGGNAGTITIDTTGTVAFTGAFDASGGSATAGGGGSPAGGMAGALKVGENTRPAAIGLTVPLTVKGGEGQAVGGGGGTVLLEPHGGDLDLGGSIDASGGDSMAQPGTGGTIVGHPGPEGASAGLDIAGSVVANGGAISMGGVGNGATGGMIKLVLLSQTGNATVEPTGQVQTDGGGSGGNGTAGGGGLMYLFTVEGNATIHGKLLSRGGAARDQGGVGGTGGFVYVFTADGHDRTSGVLLIESDGLVDASGGTGTTGGNARNDGKKGSVALFPVVQNDEYDVENVAVLINSDGVHGSDRGWISNLGTVLARGGAANGNGGDVIFHGKQQDGNETPIPGNVVDMSGDGTGISGDFAGE